MPRVLSTADISDFRERLCDAAEKLFADKGLEAVTLRHLASALGVSPMTPYRYFADKDAILAAVRARAFNRHADALEAAYRDTDGDAGARAEATRRAYIDFALENPEAYKLMFDVRQTSADDYPELVRASSRSRRTMTQHLRVLRDIGRFEGDIETAGHIYWAGLHGAAMLQLSGMLPPHLNAQALSEAIVAALDRSMKSPVKPA